MTNYYDDDGNGTPLPNTTLLVCSPLALLGARRKKLCYNFRQNLKGSHPILKKGSKGNGSASLLLVGLRPLSPFLEWGHCSIPA